MSEESVVNKFARDREYMHDNLLCLDLSERVELGGREYFRYYLQVRYNINTGNFFLGHPIQSLSSGKIYPSMNCGKVDLVAIPADVVSRYDGYERNHELKRQENRRLLRKAKFVLKNSRSSRKLSISSRLSSSNTFQSVF